MKFNPFKTDRGSALTRIFPKEFMDALKFTFNVICAPFRGLKNSGGIGKFITSKTSGVLRDWRVVRDKLKHLLKTNLELGTYHFYRGDLKSAIIRFKLISLVSHNSALVYYNLSRCYFNQGDFNLAVQKINKATLLDNKIPEINYQWQKINNPNLITRIPPAITQEHIYYLGGIYDDSQTIKDLVNERSESLLLAGLPKDKILLVGHSKFLEQEGREQKECEVTAIDPSLCNATISNYVAEPKFSDYSLIIINNLLLYYRELDDLLRSINLLPDLKMNSFNLTLDDQNSKSARPSGDPLQTKIIALVFPELSEREGLDKNNDVFLHSENSIVTALIGIRILEFKRRGNGGMVKLEILS